LLAICTQISPVGNNISATDPEVEVTVISDDDYESNSTVQNQSNPITIIEDDNSSDNSDDEDFTTLANHIKSDNYTQFYDYIKNCVHIPLTHQDKNNNTLFHLITLHKKIHFFRPIICHSKFPTELKRAFYDIKNDSHKTCIDIILEDKVNGIFDEYIDILSQKNIILNKKTQTELKPLVSEMLTIDMDPKITYNYIEQDIYRHIIKHTDQNISSFLAQCKNKKNTLIDVNIPMNQDYGFIQLHPYVYLALEGNTNLSVPSHNISLYKIIQKLINSYHLTNTNVFASIDMFFNALHPTYQNIKETIQKLNEKRKIAYNKIAKTRTLYDKQISHIKNNEYDDNTEYLHDLADFFYMHLTLAHHQLSLKNFEKAFNILKAKMESIQNQRIFTNTNNTTTSSLKRNYTYSINKQNTHMPIKKRLIYQKAQSSATNTHNSHLHNSHNNLHTRGRNNSETTHIERPSQEIIYIDESDDDQNNNGNKSTSE
jgi:hypothetical protein